MTYPFVLLSWVRPFRWFFHRKQWFVVSVVHPEGLVGELFRVKTFDEDGAIRAANYDLFERRIPQWYSWKFKVVK